MSLLNEARTYRERGEYHLALTCAQGAPEPAGRLEQARILIWLGRYEDARRLAQNGLLTLPDHPLALIVNSEAHVACGQPAEAVALARKACDAAQDDPSLGGMAHIGMAHIALASALHSNGQGEDAVATAQQALTSLDSGRPYDRALASQTLAESFHVASNYAEAANAWRRTLDLRREILDHDHPEIAVT
ncbi:MAG: tetratricopeptide repeat protein, partial [Myxococcota bacterium]